MFNCRYCSKEYTRKSAYSKHIILCEIIFYQNTTPKASQKRDSKCEEEETAPNISIQKLYNIVQELAFENNKMKEEMQEIKKYISKNVNKINILEMLNSESSQIQRPALSLEEWLKSFKVSEEDIIQIENIVDTINNLIRKNTMDKTGLPFVSFDQKQNNIYIYEKGNWKKQTHEDFILILKHIHSKLTGNLYNWYVKNKHDIQKNEKLSDQYDKMMDKIMGLNFDSTASISKLRTNIYTLVKTDLKSLHYDF